MELQVKTIIPQEFEGPLAAKIREIGVDIYVQELIIADLQKPHSVAEILAPFRAEVEQSGITDEELDALVEEIREDIVLEEKFSTQKVANQDLWQKLFAEGLITHIPGGISDEEDDFEPIEIAGEPISETIIRERR